MERQAAIAQIQQLIGKDLRPLADKLHITVFKTIHNPESNVSILKLNKGWAGHVIERYLGLPLNSSQSPNFGSWELKVVSLIHRPVAGLCVKETMAITMIDPYEVANKEFEESHLFNKLQKIVVAARIFESKLEQSSCLYSVGTFDLDNPQIFNQVKADYELVRQTLRTKGFDSLSGRMGRLVQPRTKGPGHGSRTRAFYARARFVAHIIGLKPCEL